ncbi:hypothetical protein JN535_01890 [Cellulosimicrobium cellulans]|uniref:hypothetical protein n=1 Tax=Cellulosimicrobium cellulans TaxID=1710 RepID=UPI001964D4FE|nr:hypothetical protein [Cellulosimicrobium cellulans]MBN0038923.1 hypothetical protein [Cellulosimicrobium cellulans]
MTSDGAGGTTLEGGFTSIKDAVEEVLAQVRLNASGSAILVETAQCGVGDLP